MKGVQGRISWIISTGGVAWMCWKVHEPNAGTLKKTRNHTSQAAFDNNNYELIRKCIQPPLHSL